MRLAITVVLFLSSSALARDSKYLLKITDVLQGPEAGKLDQGIKLYFGAQKHPRGEDRGEIVANEKTNAANKGDEQACRWVMLSALLKLQERARAMGGTAVVGIESYYKKVPFTSETEFECHAGAFAAGVALRGHILK